MKIRKIDIIIIILLVATLLMLLQTVWQMDVCTEALEIVRDSGGEGYVCQVCDMLEGAGILTGG